MDDSEFVWVNKTSASRSLSNNYADINARYQVNSHVQNHRIKIKRQSPDESSPSEPTSRTWRQKPSKKNGLLVSRKKPVNTNPVRLTALIVGEHGSTDPFNILAVKIDTNAHSFMQFYVQHIRSCPMAWDSKPYSSGDAMISASDTARLSEYMSNSLRYYTFISLAAAVMGSSSVTDFAARYGPAYCQQALAEIRNHISQQMIDEKELIYGVSRLFLAAVLKNDVFAAQIHLRAAKALVDKAGGLDALDPSTAICIRYGDLHLAIGTLSAPLFDLVPDAGPIDVDVVYDPSLQQTGFNVLQMSHHHLLPCLHGPLEGIVECGLVLQSSWAQQNHKMVKLEWIGGRCGMILTQLLETEFYSEANIPRRITCEAVKVTAVAWIQILSLLMNRMIGPASIRNNILSFDFKKLNSMRDSWPACVYDALLDWNDLVYTSRAQKLPEGKSSFLLLIQIAESMESESPVQLGPFMNHLISQRNYPYPNDSFLRSPTTSSCAESDTHFCR